MGQQSLLRNARVPAICPKCHAPALYRSHSTSRLDNIRRNFSPKRKFRCHTCDWRGWLDESQLSYPSVSIFTSVTAVAGEDVDIPSIRLEEEGAAADRYRIITLEREPANSAEAMKEDATSDEAPPTEESTGHAPTAAVESGPQSVATEPSANARRSPVAAGNGADEELRPPEDMLTDMPRPISEKVGTRFHHHSRNTNVACPGCGEYYLFRSRTRSLSEFLRRKLTNKRPYRCQKCGWRGWIRKRH